MEKMNDLRDLLKHEIQDLYSAEEQIIAALPTMIEKAKNADLKKALKDHLQLTQKHRSRLEQVQNTLGNGAQQTDDKKGLLSRLFKGKQVCRGMEGLIEEGNKVMKEDMDPDVLDAAIIASAQKIEHYEICGYGTARTFARELNMEDVARLLEQTLDEEYKSDDLLTHLATSRINKDAEAGGNGRSGNETRGRTTGGRSTTGESIRTETPQMEMASNERRTAATRKTAASAPKAGEAPRANTGAHNTTASRRTSAANTKTESKSTRETRSSGSSRGGSNSRNSRGR